MSITPHIAQNGNFVNPFLKVLLHELRARGLRPAVIGKHRPRIRWTEGRRTVVVHIPPVFLNPTAAFNARDLVGSILRGRSR